MTDASEVLKDVLYAGWNLAAPTKAQIRWITERKDMGPFLAGDIEVNEKFCIGVYDNRVTKRRVNMAQDALWENNVTVDIAVKVIDGEITESEAKDFREAMAAEVDRLVKLHNTGNGINPVLADWQDHAETDQYYRMVMIYNIIT